MVNVTKVFRAGRVRRWHTNPDLADTNDTLDAHQGRVARLIVALHPAPSAELLKAALTHDDGEWKVADFSSTFKDAAPPEVMAEIHRQETAAHFEIWGAHFVITQDEMKWLKFCDKLDALAWAQHHKPAVLNGDGWPEAIVWLDKTARELGLEE